MGFGSVWGFRIDELLLRLLILGSLDKYDLALLVRGMLQSQHMKISENLEISSMELSFVGLFCGNRGINIFE